MKKTLLLCLIIFAFFSCQEEEITRSEKEPDIFENEQELLAYKNFAKDLEAEFPDLEVYHLLNMDQYEAKYGHQIPESTEETEVSNAKEESTEFVPFGPYGGNGGYEFVAELNQQPNEQWRRLKYVQVWSGALIDAMRFTWKNNYGKLYSSAKFGGNGGYLRTLYLADNEYIREIRVRSGIYVDKLTFITNKKIFSVGGNGGREYIANFDNQELQCHGFQGRAAAYIDQITFYGYPGM